jgi:hypothetical protein
MRNYRRNRVDSDGKREAMNLPVVGPRGPSPCAAFPFGRASWGCWAWSFGHLEELLEKLKTEKFL